MINNSIANIKEDVNNLLLETALKYASKGWRVLPIYGVNAIEEERAKGKKPYWIKAEGKQPVIKDWQNQATTDHTLLGRWFNARSSYNIGIATGKASGFFVLDVDGDAGKESLANLEQQCGELPETIEAITGGGGRHILFKYPDNLIVGNSCKSIGKDLDIRGEGGQIVVYPSMHKSGRRYEWEAMHDFEEVPLADAPEWLLNLITQKPQPAPGPFENDPFINIRKNIPPLKSAQHIVDNCKFMQFCKEQPDAVNYVPWLAMLTNVCRGIDGDQICYELSSGYSGFDASGFRKKLIEAHKLNPTTCQSIRTAAGFTGCPAKGCAVNGKTAAAPCSFAWDKKKVEIDINTLVARLKEIDNADEQITFFNDEMCRPLADMADDLKRQKAINDIAKILKLTPTTIKKKIQHSQPYAHPDDPITYHEDVEAIKTILEKHDYALRGGMLCYAPKKYDKDGIELPKNYTPIANFIIIPTQELTYDDGVEGNKKKVFELIGYKHGKTPMTLTKIDAENFMNMNWTKKAWGLDAVISAGAMIKDKLRYITEMIGENLHIPRETIYQHTGWRKIAGKICFLHAGGAIGCDGVSVDLDCNGYNAKLNNYSLPNDDDNEKAKTIAEFFKIAAPDVIYPLLGTYMLSLLKTLLNSAGISTNFTLFLVGKTLNGKSSMAALLLNFFGPDFSTENFPANFADTSTALDRKAFLLKDVVMVIDDFRPAHSHKEKQILSTKIDNLARLYADGAGRDKGTVKGDVRGGYTARGTAIVTGEQRATVTQSGNARFYYVEITRDKIDYNGAFKNLRKNKEHLPYFTRYAIQYIAENWENIKTSVKDDFEKLEELLADVESGRNKNTSIRLILGLNILLDIVLHLKSITHEEYVFHKTQALEVIKKLCLENITAGECENPVQMFLTALNELIATKKVSLADTELFIPYSGSADESIGIPDNFIGLKDSDYYYLVPQATYKAITKHFADMQGFFPLSEKELLKRLDDERKTVCDKGRHTTTKSFKGYNNNRTARFIKISIACVSD